MRSAFCACCWSCRWPGCCSTDNYRLTLLVFAFAAATDGLDGFLAKRFGWTSELGKILDPLADKILLVGVFITLAALGVVPRLAGGDCGGSRRDHHRRRDHLQTPLRLWRAARPADSDQQAEHAVPDRLSAAGRRSARQ